MGLPRLPSLACVKRGVAKCGDQRPGGSLQASSGRPPVSVAPRSCRTPMVCSRARAVTNVSSRLGPQAEARNVRYNVLINYCKKNKVNILLTAHNLEDQVETFFIRLSRGSGLRGLSAMKPLSKLNNQVSLFRPLLDTKKKFLIKISKNIFGTYFKDPSNKNERYLRTKVRNLKKPLENSGIKYDQIFRSIQNLSLSKKTLDEYLNKIFKKLIIKFNKEISINFDEYKNLSKDTKIAIINESIKKLKKNYYDLRSKKVGNLINNIEKRDFKKATLGGCIFFKKGKNLCLKDEKP